MAIDYSKFGVAIVGPCPDCVQGRVQLASPGTMPTASICPRCGGTSVLHGVVDLVDLPSTIAQAQAQQQEAQAQEAQAQQSSETPVEA